ncbi:hypothetical protein CC85DRAFT_313533 [Cutaneotrichosporon oleaginosum]|uniref:Mitotic checkpoint regulator, MAD2B-interacting-domain-containing protein n=1 Tax=Cutaneotrichosporon oleaginosum TaxID=879819 RepID=A0A0J1AXH6_9TREE|nr:uncharacterized protein CC85DRAFT_313533 [Cutaneotrichosporon oleaginosum]KLT40019.1 hypothetical protein CC85DRAFT_313533 [Cutaneotrichosporon oleaginosum]
MLLAGYDSDSDASGSASPPPAPAPAPVPATKPVVKKKKPVKIALDLPPKAKGSGTSKEPEVEADAGADTDADAEDRPPAKRKLGGVGSSALLGMLPPPKRKLPSTGIKAKPGSASRPPTLGISMGLSRPSVDDNDHDAPAFVPKVVKRKAEENLDLFGLSEAVTKPALSLPKTTPKPTNITSAPPVSEFVPPAPSPDDPYPGYYQLPSGSWAAHDPAYYAKAVASFGNANDGLAAEEKSKAARIGRDWAALDDGRADVLEINANDGLAAGRAEAARRERLVRPKTDDFEYKPVGQTKGLAQDRHQLSSLLSSAYAQRDELEARIQENRKNMRNAQMKYGF